MRLFLIALQFLTIIPVPFAREWREEEMGRSMRWFPLAGLVIGFFLSGLDRLLSTVLPLSLTTAILVAALAIITGALHLDGVADVCDGFGARGGRERFLTVMKDSATGAIGVTGVVLVLLLKYQSLLHLPAEVRMPAIILFPAAARFAQVIVTVNACRARSDGLGATFAAGTRFRETAVAAVTIFAAGWFFSGINGVYCCMITAVFALLVKLYFHRRLGGITGDIIGAASETAEVLYLLAAVALAGV